MAWNTSSFVRVLQTFDSVPVYSNLIEFVALGAARFSTFIWLLKLARPEQRQKFSFQTAKDRFQVPSGIITAFRN